MNRSDQNSFFVRGLKEWNTDSNTREMPWKGERNPYKIWLSEIILQQTRVEQGLEYYNRIIIKYPTVQDLAEASETEVFKLWEGLGYYTRCKNLIATARYIASELAGKFPDKYLDILALKGIGPYTAAAIGSFAFDLPHAVVDGNVFRVLARYFGIDTPTDSTEGKRLFNDLANRLLDKAQPAIYNQALMDFGAVVCKPQIPLCTNCALNGGCKAYLKGLVNQLPVKEKTIKKRDRWFYYYVIEHNDCIYVRKRGVRDIWENLYEFVLTEKMEAPISEDAWQAEMQKEYTGKKKIRPIHISPFYKQVLTHQTIRGQFIHIKIEAPVLLKTYELIPKSALYKLPFPKFISNYLKDKNVSLNLFDSSSDQNLIELISTS